MTLLITCWTSRLRWRASGSTLRTCAAARRGKLLGLHAVHRPRLLAIRHAGGVKRSADHLVAVTREILDSAATDQHDRVLLKVVSLARDVGIDLHPVCEPHARDLAQRRVRLLGGR